MACDEFIDHVEVMGQHAVEADNLARDYAEAGLRVCWTRECAEPVGWVFLGKLIKPQGAFIPLRITPPPVC